MIGRLRASGSMTFQLSRYGRLVFRRAVIASLETQLKGAERHAETKLAEYEGARGEVRRLKAQIIAAKKEAKNGNRKRAVSTRANRKQRQRSDERQPATDQPTS